MDGPLPEGLAEMWNTFLQESHQPEDVFKHPVLFPLQRQREWSEMARLANIVSPFTIMDIGCDKGGDLYLWCKVCQPRRVIACEVRGTPYAQAFEKAFPRIEFLWLPQSSYAPVTISQVSQWLKHHDCKIDVLFIDGDKSWFHLDYAAYQPMMSRCGVAFMHDIQDAAPYESFKMCRQGSRESFTFIDIQDSTDAMSSDPVTEYDNWLRYWQGRSCGVGVIYP